MKSPKAATVPALMGPNLIAAITTGTKAKPIFKFHNEIDKKRDNTTSVAINTPLMQCLWY